MLTEDSLHIHSSQVEQRNRLKGSGRRGKKDRNRGKRWRKEAQAFQCALLVLSLSCPRGYTDSCLLSIVGLR